MTPIFLPGVELCRAFFHEAVRPVLDDAFPGLRYAAARIGPGSDVLGYDSARSTDHDWGPRLTVLLDPGDAARCAADVSAALSERLPARVRGWPTRYTRHADGTDALDWAGDPAARHHVVLADLGSHLVELLGFDPRAGVRTADWLATPSQRLAEVTGGAVFHDTLGGEGGEDGAHGAGTLTALRSRLAFYPDDVWRHLLAALWVRLDQEEPFVGRTAEAGDDLGSRMVAARQARELMRLCLLLDRRYPPYTKWLGTAFARVRRAAPVAASLGAALAADEGSTRQRALAGAYEAVAAWQNDILLPGGEPLADRCDPTPRPFHARPYPVLGARRFADALTSRIGDIALTAEPLLGAVDQYVDGTDALVRPALARAVAATVAVRPGTV